ncbi:MAG: hypothetical protein HZB38_16825 [Planctomycetes bacterium]|nr:hypothetical protein [Planctomycetota bacterium]
MLISPTVALHSLAAALAVVLAGCGSEPGTAAPPLRIIGQTGIGPGEFNYPRAAVVSGNGDLYVVDKGGRIQEFDPDGKFVRGWTMPEFNAGKPTGLGAGPDGRIYAADTHYARVTVFTAEGTLDRQFGAYGDGPGQFRLPTDVLVDGQGYIFVAEYGGNDRISKYTPDWLFVTSFGGPDAGAASLRRPQGLCLAPDSTLWVADSCNHRICHFTSDGRYIGSFGESGARPGQMRFPYNVEMLPDGTLAVVEYENNHVQRFDVNGKSLGIWGRAGREAGELAYPWAVVVDKRGRLFVVDSGNNRVQVIDPAANGAWVQ